MYENVKIGIIGGDMRQVALGRRLSDIGFEVAAWGLPSNVDIGNMVRCGDWRSAVNKSKAVILPLPASYDGVRVNVPHSNGCELRVLQFMEIMTADTLLLGGKFDLGIKDVANDNNIPLIDYFECEELQVKNAVPTAEGAIEIAMREIPVTINGCNALVCGYGRIGKVLSSLLKNMGANVCVSARRQDDLAYIKIFGCTPLKYGSAEFDTALHNADVVFNTVPAKILNKKVLSELKRCSLIVDLASGKGGTDFDAAEKQGIKCIHALSLPGKVAPSTAGEIICDCIFEILLREGVIAKP